MPGSKHSSRDIKANFTRLHKMKRRKQYYNQSNCIKLYLFQKKQFCLIILWKKLTPFHIIKSSIANHRTKELGNVSLQSIQHFGSLCTLLPPTLDSALSQLYDKPHDINRRYLAWLVTKNQPAIYGKPKTTYRLYIIKLKMWNSFYTSPHIQPLIHHFHWKETKLSQPKLNKNRYTSKLKLD